MAKSEEEIAAEEAQKRLENTHKTPKPELADENITVETKKEPTPSTVFKETQSRLETNPLKSDDAGLTKEQQDALTFAVKTKTMPKLKVEDNTLVHSEEATKSFDDIAPPSALPTIPKPNSKPRPNLSNEQKNEKIQELAEKLNKSPNDIRNDFIFIIDDKIEGLVQRLNLPKNEVIVLVEPIIDEVLNLQDPTDKPSEVIYEEIQKALYGTNTPGETIQVGPIDNYIELLENKALSVDDVVDTPEEADEEARNTLRPGM